MLKLFNMESSRGGLNDEYDYQDIVKGVNNLFCPCRLWIGKNYIHKKKHDEFYG